MNKFIFFIMIVAMTMLTAMTTAAAAATNSGSDGVIAFEAGATNTCLGCHEDAAIMGGSVLKMPFLATSVANGTLDTDV